MTLRKWMFAGMMSLTLMGGVAPAYAQRGPDGPPRGAHTGNQIGGPHGARPDPSGRMRDGRNWGGGDRQGGRQAWQDRRGGDWRADGRNDWRGNARPEWRGGQGGRGPDMRWNSARRFDDRGRWADQRRWDDGWRRDSRYGWRDYRALHGDRFRIGRYYAPRGWDYGYQRFSVGILLSSMLYSKYYWLNDPGSYRLPPAYGALQWVRYYDDALLVDTRDGYVADVIHDFFW